MLMYQPTKYLEFASYCKWRKIYSRRYRELKVQNEQGRLRNAEYLQALLKLREKLIELEIKYFDILPMRL